AVLSVDGFHEIPPGMFEIGNASDRAVGLSPSIATDRVVNRGELAVAPRNGRRAVITARALDAGLRVAGGFVRQDSAVRRQDVEKGRFKRIPFQMPPGMQHVRDGLYVGLCDDLGRRSGEEPRG